MRIRQRVAEMGLQYSEEVECSEAIREMTEMLRSVLLGRVEVPKGIQNYIAEKVCKVLEGQHDLQRIVDYHLLLWKTASIEEWTLERRPGQSKIIPYLPKILLATQMKVSGETAVNGEGIECDVFQHSNLAQSKWPVTWREVNVLEFVHGSQNAKTPEDGLSSQPVVQVITSKERMRTWRQAHDGDELNGEAIFTSDNQKQYAMTNSDYRKLFEYRPPLLRNMVLGQLAAEYTLLYQSVIGYEAAKNSIDPQTGLGPDSTTYIAGTRMFAPHCFQLENKKIMRKRKNAKAALLLLNTNAAHKHGNQLLWTPWQELEEVTGNQDEHETEEQKKVRLAIYPMSHPTTKIEDED